MYNHRYLNQLNYEKESMKPIYFDMDGNPVKFSPNPKYPGDENAELLRNMLNQNPYSPQKGSGEPVLPPHGTMLELLTRINETLGAIGLYMADDPEAFRITWLQMETVVREYLRSQLEGPPNE